MREKDLKAESVPKVLACQHGARRRYAVPRMLEAAGLLERFYTDSTAHSPLGRLAGAIGDRGPAAVKRLANRQVNGVPPQKRYSSDAYNLYEIGQKLIGREKKSTALFVQRDRMLSKTMKRWGLGDADIVYSMYHENLDFIRWAKAQGRGIVSDVYINPKTHALMRAEFEAFPDWGGCPAPEAAALEEELWKETARLADILICPSEWVASGVRELTPAAADKIRIVPYGSSIDYHGRTNDPVPGRVLFAGGYPLRKGMRYLAEAATLLKQTHPQVDVRVAGLFPAEVTEHPLCRDLHFLGKLSKDEMQQEYLSADCFALPSLSEGFAGVVAEAIRAGCPVVVTPESGSPIEDGREGLLFEAYCAEALADAVGRMVGDRGFRTQCSMHCLEQASFYSESVWRKRLVSAVLEADPERAAP